MPDSDYCSCRILYFLSYSVLRELWEVAVHVRFPCAELALGIPSLASLTWCMCLVSRWNLWTTVPWVRCTAASDGAPLLLGSPEDSICCMTVCGVFLFFGKFLGKFDQKLPWFIWSSRFKILPHALFYSLKPVTPSVPLLALSSTLFAIARFSLASIDSTTANHFCFAGAPQLVAQEIKIRFTSIVNVLYIKKEKRKEKK